MCQFLHLMLYSPQLLYLRPGFKCIAKYRISLLPLFSTPPHSVCFNVYSVKLSAYDNSFFKQARHEGMCVVPPWFWLEVKGKLHAPSFLPPQILLPNVQVPLWDPEAIWILWQRTKYFPVLGFVPLFLCLSTVCPIPYVDRAI